VTTSGKTSAPLTLAIEMTNPSVPTPGVLLAPGDPVLASRGLTQAGRHDDALLPAIAGLFAESDHEPSELDEVLVSIGPGGFTATRLAVVGAAVLAECCGARVLAVPSTRVAAELAWQGGGIGQGLVVALGVKGPTAYVARFDPVGGGSLDEGASMTHEGLASVLLPGDGLVYEDHLPALMLEVASQGGHRCIPMRLTAEGLLGCRSAAQRVPVEALRPIYPREPDAVTQWRRRHGWAPGDA